MERIVVTDIFGNETIDNSTPFILIRVGNPEKIVYYLDGEGDQRIFRINPKGVEYALKRNNINPNSYVYCGDLFNEKRFFNTTNILLVNKKYTTETTQFLKLRTFANGSIYTPIASPGFQIVGLVYAHRGFRPVKAYVVNYSLLKYSNYNVGLLGRANEYHYLGSNQVKNYTVDKKKVFEVSNNKSRIVGDNESLDSIESLDSWINRKGKSVILVTPDTPWFIKKGKKAHHIDTIPKPVFVTKPIGLKSSTNQEFVNNASYKTSQTIDPTRFDLGYGYSYASRLEGINCKTKEVDNIYELFANGPHKEEITNTTKILTIIMIFLVFILIFLTLINLKKDFKKN